MLETTLRRIVPPPAAAAAPPVGGPPKSATSLVSQALLQQPQQPQNTNNTNLLLPTRQRCVACPAPHLLLYALDVVEPSAAAAAAAHRRIVLQHSGTREVLWQIIFKDLVKKLLFDDVVVSKEPSPQQMTKALRTLGHVQQLDLMDPSTVLCRSFNNNNNKQQQQEWWFQYVVMRFPQRIVVWNIRTNALVAHIHPHQKNHPGSGSSTTVTPSTSLVALTRRLAVLGCADGSIRVWDLQQQRSVKSARVMSQSMTTSSTSSSTTSSSSSSSSKSEHAVWQIQAVQPYHHDVDHHHGEENDVIKDATNSPKVSVVRLVAVHVKGTAFVWELAVTHQQFNSNNNNSDDVKVDIRPPLARLDGYMTAGMLSSALWDGAGRWDHHHHGTARSGSGSTTTTTAKMDVTTGGGTASCSADVSSSSASSSTTTSPPWEHNWIDYDGHRDWLVWFVPQYGRTGSSSSNRAPHVLVWDLRQHLPPMSSNNMVPLAPSSSSGSPSPRRNLPPPKMEPLVISLACLESAIMSSTSGSSTGGGGSSSIPSSYTVMSAWAHPAFGENDLVSVAITAAGDLYIAAARLPVQREGGRQTSTTATAGSSSEPLKATLVYHVTLSSILQQYRGGVESSTAAILPQQPRVRAHKLVLPRRHDPSALVVAMDELGLAWMRVEESFNSFHLARHCYLGAGMAEYAKSVLVVSSSSSVEWAQLYGAHKKNPRGLVQLKPSTRTVVYQSPSAATRNMLQLPKEVQKQTWNGLLPRFLPSPSGQFLCLFWQEEERYEILHLVSLLRRSDGGGGGGGALYSPAVSSGKDVISFAWVGDDDVFAVLHPASAGAEQSANPSSSLLMRSESFRTTTTTSSSKESPSGGGGSSKKNAFRKSFDFVRKGTSASPSVGGGGGKNVPPTPSPAANEDYTSDSSRTQPRVELKMLVGVTANAAEISGSISAATETTIGEMTLRGGPSRSPPTALFGGPVLCVASRDSSKDGGTAYFYTRKSDEKRASSYVSSGPSLPYPDLVEWDEDGRLCAVVVESRVAIYLSEAPQFVLLGTVQLGSSMEVDVTVCSAKFIHGVLYCTTKTSVQCIFLGNLNDGVCYLDSFVLASTDPPRLGNSKMSWAPPSIHMTLNHPIVLGHQGGSLLLSTASGLRAVPMNHPILRIGCLLAAGQPARAQPWFASVPLSHHEALASFLERRGEPVLAADLPGLSLESSVDLCMRYGLAERLEAIIDIFGLDSIRRIDGGRDVVPGSAGQQQDGCHSLVVCVGAFLLGQGKAELVRRLATECLRSGEAGQKDAFVLAGLLLAVDPSDARRLMKRAVGVSGRSADGQGHVTESESPILALVRDHVL